MSWAVKHISFIYLLASIVICSNPRCDFIIKCLNNFEIATASISCHEEGDGDTQGYSKRISNERYCQCELMAFVVTPPPQTVQSIEKIEAELFFINSSHKLYWLLNIIPEIPIPPPELFV